MKIKSLNTILSWFLLTQILFSQVGVGLLHNHERDKEDRIVKNSSKFVLKKNSGRCKVCSLDIYHELFFFTGYEFHFLNPSVPIYEETELTFIAYNPSFLQSRAPPVSAILIL